MSAAVQDSVSLIKGLTAHTTYAQLQRLLAVGVYSNCLRVLLPVTAADKGTHSSRGVSGAVDGEIDTVIYCKRLDSWVSTHTLI